MSENQPMNDAPFVPTVAQAIYGAEHGSYDVPGWADDMFVGMLREWDRVYWNIHQKPWEEHDCQIGTVFYRPYCWGECNCGFVERWAPKEAAWEAAHPHADACYQSVLKARMAVWDAEHRHTELEARAFGPGGVTLFSGFDQQVEHPAPGVTTMVGSPRTDMAMEAWRMSHDARRTFEDAVYNELTASFGLSDVGCAVHCTCGKDEAWRQFRATDDHADTCQIVVPNFGVTGDRVQLRWYKRPGRGMSVNLPLTADEWIAWRDKVTDALNRAEHVHEISRSGWCGRGKLSCPYCNESPTEIRERGTP
jgi:hypothetical protein